MTEEQREEDIQQIFERFGSSVGDVLKRARLARETKSVIGKTARTIDTSGEHHSQGHSTPNLINFLVFNLLNSYIVFQLYQNLEIQMRERWAIPNYVYGHLAYSTYLINSTISPFSALSSANSSRPSGRADRTLRFAAKSSRCLRLRICSSIAKTKGSRSSASRSNTWRFCHFFG